MQDLNRHNRKRIVSLQHLHSQNFVRADIPETMWPTMLVVIDTEEEFDWNAPFSRDARSTQNLHELWRLQEVFDRHGVVPLYVVDYPVTEDESAVRWFSALRERGRCEIGAHLHPWVTPPYEEEVNRANSYSCNLPPELEHRKIAALTSAVENAFGFRPTAFRTGRYGVGPSTFEALLANGYTTDLSLAPHSSFCDQGGPQFYGWHNAPFWVDHEQRLLSFPVTTGFSGVLRKAGGAVAPLLDAPLARRLHFPGFMARTGLMDRARLTPEGMTAEGIHRLLSAFVADGERVLTLSLHSSTLLSGATAYAQDDDARDHFIARIDLLLRGFIELGGRFASVSSTDAAIRRTAPVCQALSRLG